MSPLDTQFDDETAEPEKGLVPFLGHMIPEKNARELQLFLDELGGADEYVEKLRDSIRIKNGVLIIDWLGGLDVVNKPITSIPSGFTTNGALRLTRCDRLSSLPRHLHAQVLHITDCRSLRVLPEGMRLKSLTLRKLKNLETFPNDIIITTFCLIEDTFFGLNYDVYKKIYEHKRAGNIMDEVSFPFGFEPDLNQEQFLHTLVYGNDDARDYLIDHFSHFRELPYAVELGLAACLAKESPLANLQWAFLDNFGEESIAQLRDHFDIEDAEPSEALLNHADFVVEACVRSIKAQAAMIQKVFESNPHDTRTRQHCLKKAQEVHPRHVQTLKLILPENIIRRLMARGKSAQALKFLLT